MVDRETTLILVSEARVILARWDSICLAMENVPSRASLEAMCAAVRDFKTVSDGLQDTELIDFSAIVKDAADSLLADQTFATPPIMAIFLDCQSLLSEWIETLGLNGVFVPDTALLTRRLGILLPRLVEDAKPDLPGDQDVSNESAAEPDPNISQPRNIGDILVRAGHVTQHQIEDAIRLQNARLGSILVAQGATSPQAVLEALEVQKQQGTSIDESVRVSLQRLDSLVRLVGDLAIQHSIVANASEQGAFLTSVTNEAITRISDLLDELRADVINLRSIALEGMFRRLERLAQESAGFRSRRLNVTIRGEDTQIDRNVIERLREPLIAVIRSMVENGIESERERDRRGKSARGSLVLEAVQMPTTLRVIIEDDGSGDSSHLSAGSAAESPRPLDELRRAVQSVNGRVDLRTEPGCGTKVMIDLPCSLVLIPAIVVEVGETVYAVPMTDVDQVLDVKNLQTQTKKDAGRMVAVEGKLIPLERLAALLPRAENEKPGRESAVALLTSDGHAKLALLVDSIRGQQTIVVRPVHNALESLPGFAGATILSNGDPAMIVHVPEIHRIHRARRLEVAS